MKTKKNIQSMPIYEKKTKKNCCEDKDVDLLLIEEKKKSTMFLLQYIHV